MLRELIRERLITAADEIFGLFARTISSYEEQLGRAREEAKRHRRQLKALDQAPTVRRVQDVQQRGGSSSLEEEEEEDPQPSHSKEEPERPRRLVVKEEEEEVEVNNFPLTTVSEGSEGDKPPEWSKCHCYSPGPPPHRFLAPLSDSDDTEGPLRSAADCDGANKHLTYFQKKTTLGNKRTSQTRKKSFICSVCGKHLANNSVLIIHMRKHTGEKPFLCSVCGKAFVQKSHLASHMITHTGEKPFSCSVCGVRFSYKCNLNTHLRKHKTE